MVVVEQLVDPQEAGRVGAGQLLDPPAQLLGVLARHRTAPGGAHSAAATTSPAVV